MFRSWLLASLFSILPFSFAYANALELAVGSWGFNPYSDNQAVAEELSCNADAMVITISEDGKRYQGLRETNQYQTADILDSGPNYLTIRYDGEERMMNDDEPQIWTMLLVDKDTFVWVLGEKGRTLSGPSEPRYRCKFDLG
jgi:hypothetical protein